MGASYSPDKLDLRALPNFPLVRRGDALPMLISDAVHASDWQVRDHDVLAVAQKIVSKAEGRSVSLSDVVPSAEAERRAGETGKDSRLVELILQESTEVVRQGEHLIIAENHLGMVMANAGIDLSNVDDDCALLLPRDPDHSAAEIKSHIDWEFGVNVGVIIVDSVGRAWRNGITGQAIGVAGITALLDLRKSSDLNDRELRVSEVAVADEIASASSLLMGQAAEGKPVVLVRGFENIQGTASARDLLRPRHKDLFR